MQLSDASERARARLAKPNCGERPGIRRAADVDARQSITWEASKQASRQALRSKQHGGGGGSDRRAGAGGVHCIGDFESLGGARRCLLDCVGGETNVVSRHRPDIYRLIQTPREALMNQLPCLALPCPRLTILESGNKAMKASRGTG